MVNENSQIAQMHHAFAEHSNAFVDYFVCVSPIRNDDSFF